MDLMNKDLVSIILPYYKKKDYFLESFNSAYNQTYKKKEIIIVYDDDDLSDLNFIKKIIRNKKNVYLHLNKKKHGVGSARNIAINKSRGEFLAFIDSDDVWQKHKLKKQIKFMNSKKINASFTSYSVINNSGKVIDFRPAKKKITYEDLIFSCDIGLSTVVLRKNKKIKKIIKFPDLKTKEDYVLWINLSKKKIDFFGLKKNLSKWRKLKDSLSSNLLQKLIDGFRVYHIYLKFNFLKSILYLFLLSINYLKKSI
jgi:teichuronic acid biosynthesis glycosyltransferase TuaG